MFIIEVKHPSNTENFNEIVLSQITEVIYFYWCGK